MKNDKRFKMISLRAQAVELEVEVIADQDKVYEKQFVNDFQDVLSFLNEEHVKKLEKTKENDSEDPGDSDDGYIETAPKQEKHESLKKLYRALARKTHPDIDESLNSEDFRTIQKAYNESDIFSLFVYASKYKIVLDFSNEDLNYMEKAIESRREKIGKIKESVRWIWAVDRNKNEKLYSEIMHSMGVDIALYKAWKENKAID